MKIFDKEEKDQVYSLASEVSHYIYFLHWFFKISYINQGKLGDSLKNLRGKHKVEKIIFIFFLLFGKKKIILKVPIHQLPEYQCPWGCIWIF